LLQPVAKHKIFYGAFAAIHLLALDAKTSVATSLALNLQMSLIEIKFCKKMVQQK